MNTPEHGPVSTPVKMLAIENIDEPVESVANAIPVITNPEKTTDGRARHCDVIICIVASQITGNLTVNQLLIVNANNEADVSVPRAKGVPITKG